MGKINFTELSDLHELKTIEIDIENKVFKVNGEQFGKRVKRFSLHSCFKKGGARWEVSLDLDQNITFSADYDRKGNMLKEKVTPIKCDRAE